MYHLAARGEIETEPIDRDAKWCAGGKLLGIDEKKLQKYLADKLDIPIHVKNGDAHNGQNATPSVLRPESTTQTQTKEIRKKRSREKRERWKAMRERGMSYGQIANAEGVTREAVIHALQRLDLGADNNIVSRL